MGLVFVEAIVSGPRKKRATVELLVDSGAKYSLLPKKVWMALGLKPKRRLRFTLADGTSIERDVSECHFVLSGIDGHSPVVLGEAHDEALLGVVTLASLGLVLNPFERTLRPARMMLA